MIIRFLGENVKKYLEEFQSGLKSLNRNCPYCNNRCNKHGTYERYVIENGLAILIPIQCLYCKQCKKNHAVIPDFLRPYSPFPQKIREEVTCLTNMGVSKTKIAREYGITRELIRFWQKEFHQRAPEVCATIQSSFPNDKEYRTNSFWCYLQGIVKALVEPKENLLGLANQLANASGQRVWV